MAHSVKSSWKGKSAFDCQIDDHTFRIDDKPPSGDGSGPSPKKLLLASLVGCTGVDVAGLLKKMRVPYTGLDVDAEADLSDDYPKVYTVIRLIYRVYGKDINPEKVEKAVKLSKEKYCGVSAMLSKGSTLEYRIEYVNEE